MANYDAGDVIRLMRTATGISQEELSYGICSVETLSRIENGKHTIKQSTYTELMSKMERDTRKNYALCAGTDMELLEERIQLEDAIAKHDYEDADRYLHILKRKIEDSKISRQYVTRLEGVIDYQLNRIDAEEYIKKMDAAIKITVPEYERFLQIEEKWRVYPFTELEMLTLMSLAGAYGDAEKPEKGIQIFHILFLGLDNGYMDDENVRRLQMLIKRNYIKLLEMSGRYQEALDTSKMLLKAVIENNYGRMIPVVLAEISWNMRKVYIDNKKTKEGISSDIKKMLRQAYYIAAARNDEVILKIIKADYSNYFEEKV